MLYNNVLFYIFIYVLIPPSFSFSILFSNLLILYYLFPYTYFFIF